MNAQLSGANSSPLPAFAVLRPRQAGPDRWADQWGLSRYDNPAHVVARGTSMVGTPCCDVRGYRSAMSLPMFVALATFLLISTARAVEPGPEGKTNLEIALSTMGK